MAAISTVPKANFTFAPAALAAIERIRADWKLKFPGEEPDVVSVAWGLYHFNNGARDERVVVSFYTHDMRPEIQQHIQIISGLEVIFFTIDRYVHHFEGKVIDFTEEQFFFLRDP